MCLSWGIAANGRYRPYSLRRWDGVDLVGAGKREKKERDWGRKQTDWISKLKGWKGHCSFFPNLVRSRLPCWIGLRIPVVWSRFSTLIIQNISRKPMGLHPFLHSPSPPSTFGTWRDFVPLAMEFPFSILRWKMPALPIDTCSVNLCLILLKKIHPMALH